MPDTMTGIFRGSFLSRQKNVISFSVSKRVLPGPHDISVSCVPWDTNFNKKTIKHTFLSTRKIATKILTVFKVNLEH